MDNCSVSVVEAILKNKENKILLLKRSNKNKHFKGMWQLPGGKVEFGEKIDAAIKREIQEEIGCSKLKLKLSKVFSIDGIFDGDVTIFLMIFKGTILNVEKLSEDHTEFKFFSMLQIKKLKLAPVSKKALLG